VIPDAKRRGLEQALRRGPVRFKNGAMVDRHPDHGADLLVTRPDGDSVVTTVVNQHAHDQIGWAYLIALAEPPPPPPPSSAPIKRTRSRTDFGDCPF
jgi:hypothetical protein